MLLVNSMATAPKLVALQEYLNTDYSPDCEYIDGAVIERNVGKIKHAFSHTEVVFQLKILLKGRSEFAVVEQRVRVSPNRVRIPDVCVIAAWTKKSSVSHRCLCGDFLTRGSLEPGQRFRRRLSEHGCALRVGHRSLSASGVDL